MAAIAAEYSPKIQKRTLKGHRKPVLCLAHSSERLAYYSSSSGNNNTTPSQSNEPQQKAHHPNPSLLLSGSEDGTARLWDLRTRKTALCMVIPHEENDDGIEVTSVAFHPSVAEERQKGASNDGDECKENTTLLPIHHDCIVYASTENNIYGFDLRHHSTSSTAPTPIIKTPHFDLSPLFQCTDEINQLSFSFPKRNDGTGKYFMSAADDSGEAHVVTECLPRRYEGTPPNTTTTGKKPKIFCHAEPETMAITSSAVFQPRTNSECYMATGGTDCTVKLWDVNRPRRPTCTIQIKPAKSENTTQLCNPPYVHDVSWSPSGRLLAAGIGDGSCIVLRAEGQRLVEIGRLGYDEGGHSSAVAAVCFPGFGSCQQRELLSALRVSPKVRKCGEAEDRLMISAGNDGNIVFWDLGGNMVGSGPLDPVTYLGKCLSPPDDAKVGGDDVKDATNAMESIDISSQNGKSKSKKGKGTNSNNFPEELTPSPPKVLFRIAHRQKPNWITCSRAADDVLPTSLFVADTTNNISVYTLPC